MRNIRIFADNTCDLNNDLLAKYNVKCLHMPVTINGITYRDRLDIQPAEFYKELEKSSDFPKTAQISPAEFMKAFQEVLTTSDDEIIYIAFSSQLSGTYQSACLARDMMDTDRITVIDSLSASVGYGLIVLQAAKAVMQGEKKEAILSLVQDMITRMEHIFIVGNFEMLKRGGRVNYATATIGNLLNIKLILHIIDGKILLLEKVHGLKKAQKRLIEIMAERGKDLHTQTVGICHANDLEGAKFLQELVIENFGCDKFLISEMGAAIGSHVGAGTNGIVFLRK